MRWWLVLGLVWATGCGAAKKSSYEPSASYKMADHEGRFGGAASNENTYMLDDMMPAPAPPPMEVMDDDGMADVMLAAPEAEAAPSTPSEPPDDGPARMVFYDGWAQVRTPRAEELVDEVVSLVESVDGYVESRGLDRVSARVPVERFDEVWAQVLAMGPVERRHLGADDVTDAFADLSLRLKSLEATRERLAELLAKATEERDKLELIQQIHRLTEQIEVMQAQVQTLQNLASMSRLTVEAVAPELHGHVAAELPAGMQWIDGLSAWSTWISGALDKPVKLPTPEGFVRLDKREYSLQSADGATLRGLSLRNDPQGSAAFWRQAVVDRIGEQLDDGATTDTSGWAMVRFVEQGAKEPYVWHLGFRVHGKHLQVLQLTYPTEVLEARYHSEVLAVLGGGAS